MFVLDDIITSPMVSNAIIIIIIIIIINTFKYAKLYKKAPYGESITEAHHSRLN